ncbi:ATP-dependent zinc metalloprotease FtsH [Lacrimispora indolis]|uniref:ATP-dependent zinc metalloprotease FtsH n=1 Tax=Lacrimispora indolis TaxID=69825 RepID=UPI0003F4FD07|nr:MULTISPECIES: ATP-dependent zinc metalloprotease FtsH [Lachnospiraceae]MBE7719851.1 ATP-dependent zinc metalloprotease FtsH [Lacrimispora celerecrescens]
MGLKDDSNSQKNPKKSFIYYYVIVLLVMIIFNAMTVPWLQSKTVTEVPYSTFLEMVDQGKVQAVAKTETEIQFKSDTGKKDWEGKPVYDVYKTGLWPDDTLTERLIAHDVSFEKTIVEQMSPVFSFLLTWIIPILIFVFLGNFLSGQMQKRMGGGNAMTFGKSSPKIYAESETGKTFRDVAGQEEAKEALKEIVDFLHNPQKYADIGASLPKGALLVGPPGTGKTLLARAVAGEAHVPFFSISGSEFVEMFVGMGAAKVRDLFKQASEKAPCIVFIDEIDTIGKKRDGGGFTGNDEREQTLNQLLAEMDGFDGRKGVVILAATNRPDSLDKALLRPGRFDRRIPVELPDLNGREAILKVHGKNVKLSDDVDFRGVALATAGSSGAELANIVNEAALRAVRLGRKTVTQRDLEESVEVVIAGYQKKDSSVSGRERKIIAYHEVGHALVAACQNNSAPVHKITIIPRTSGALGYTMQVDEEERYLLTKEAALSKIATFTGGRAAEELVFNTVTSGAANDIEQATRIARAMVTRYGMSDEFDMVALETVTNQYLGGDTALACSPETAKRIDEAVITIVKEQHQKALKILKDHEKRLHEIAEYLLERETITGEEFMKIAGFDSAAVQKG